MGKSGTRSRGLRRTIRRSRKAGKGMWRDETAKED